MGESPFFCYHEGIMRLYNTLSRKKEELKLPADQGEIKMYTCGQTVYDYTHIGNWRSHIAADTVRRTLENAGYTVHAVKNITDVGHLTADDLAQGDSGEDKIAKKAKAEGKTPATIARFYEDYFHAGEAKLNILPPREAPRATEHISQMIKLIEKLIEKGHAYEVNGNVFYDVTSFGTYGMLSGNTLENLKVGARLEEHPDKRHPWDFALWLKAPEGHLMHWPSPWSEGYPGWHIECSAMSMEYLDETLDIHTGGEDNIFPHHEAEIAQSEGVTGKTFVHIWMHTRHLLVNGEKMSKSMGNFYKLEDLRERGYSPMDLRMLFLGSHYRSQMNFTWDALDQAKKNKETLFAALTRAREGKEGGEYTGEKKMGKIEEAMQDDLNTPLALSYALEMCRKVNMFLDKGEGVAKEALVKNFEKLFFLFGLREETIEIPRDIQDLLNAREKARRGKNFEQSDDLRKAIEAKGFLVEDTATGQKARKK